MHIANSTLFSFNFLVNFLVAFMALAVAYYSYRAHKVIKTKEFGYYSLGFLSFAAGFAVHTFSMFVWALNACHIPKTLTAYTHSACILLFNFFVMLGVFLILLATTKLKKSTTAIYIFMLILVISLLHTSLFYITTTLLLLIIAFNYFVKFINKKNHNSLLILISILLLLVGIIRFIYIQRYFSLSQPFFFLVSFFIMFWVVIKVYRG